MLSEMNKELKGLRCVVSGSGKIAMHVLEKLIAYGALPVSVSDSKGYLVDEDGFDYMKIQFLRYIKAQQRSLRYGGIELWVIKIRGSAFLWHHVRCMVAVLFMIGKGLESPNVIDMLLDTTSIPRKQYTMASDIPLVLQSCEFEDIKFICS
ncbi:tRNA pseudouridine(38/39) synthase-like [Arachis ipaensis]|uniref:tRNA pseudouridine(38/39) synthase-like n=1 Tax=Arachis ipaensis TaxID=130454 RepID=UPI000A2B103D|nr:tRNA pseudouridine(38/39) synthase-like [Arachis ipaensis]XP_025673342.1 tRNA pseudouridine(38/39) synthase isoform X1 [Arachis hypogaea]XP_025673343.1 tRNA pseudouridine(38/39) synthase isoform X1 [Arachis hypogaea]